MTIFVSTPWLRVFSGLFIDLGALWLSLAFITPNFSSLTQLNALAVLTGNIASAILSLLLAVKIEAILES